jgi:glycosyltransferase involved in cell wall biosynthesis
MASAIATELAGIEGAWPGAGEASTAALRVLHVINGEHYAGAERVQDLLALRLPEFGFEAGFACLKPGVFADARLARCTPLYATPMRSRADLSAVRRIAGIVRDEGYALVHAHTARSALVGRLASLLSGVPMVYHVHSPTVRDTTRPVANWVNAAVERLSLVGVRRLIAVSESLGRHMRGRGLSASRVTVIHNGVPAPAHVAERTPPAGTWTLGVVALMRPRKGIEVLIDALAELRGAGHDVRLLAVGAFETADYEAMLRRRAADRAVAPWVEWTGFRRDVSAELSRMDLFVLPSLFGEGLPMVVLEAMAHGVPVIASRVEGVPEAISDGREGLLTRPGDAGELAAAVARFIRRDVDWRQIRAAALCRHAAEFSDRTMAARVARVYRDVLGMAA